MPRITRRVRAAVTALGLSAALVAAGTASAQAAELPEGGLLEAGAAYLASPGAVAGANDWKCKPSAEHPNPVVLLPGTFFNIGSNFVKLSPRLKNNGYCVFGLNYGHTIVSFDRVGGLAPVKSSADQLDAFVDKVRAATGSDKVDVVGHSQGGAVPVWWIKKGGGAAKVAHYVGWAPSSHGTDLNGIATFADKLKLMGFATGLATVLQFPGVLDQAYTSDFIKDLWADGKTVPPGPDYTVIATKSDHVVTPYTTQALDGENTHNIVLQDKCAADGAGHAGLAFDDPTMQLTLNALSDGPADFQPKCVGFGPSLF